MDRLLSLDEDEIELLGSDARSPTGQIESSKDANNNKPKLNSESKSKSKLASSKSDSKIANSKKSDSKSESKIANKRNYRKLSFDETASPAGKGARGSPVSKGGLEHTRSHVCLFLLSISTQSDLSLFPATGEAREG